VSQPGPPVRLVLDQSALLAYVAGSMHVAEPIHEVVEDGVRFGLSAVAAAEVLAELKGADDRRNLLRLLELNACAVLPSLGESWRELASWRGRTDRIEQAAAALAATEYDAPVLTSEGSHYRDEDLAVIPFEA
jgi:hypothetical protein